MTVVEYQLTLRELLFVGTCHDFKQPLSIISLLLVTLGEMLAIKSGANPFFNLVTFGVTVILLIRISMIYRLIASNPTATLRTRFSFDETGFLFTNPELRVERTWHSLRSWSQSRNYFYLHSEKKGGHFTLIPKRAFTVRQLGEFITLLKEIYSHQRPQPPPRPAREKGDISDVRLPRIQQLDDPRVFMGPGNKITGTLFLSYAREDSDTALRLFKELRNAGIDVWLDTEYLLAGQNWKATIEQAIRGCRFFLAVLSNNSVSKKGYVQNELKHALEILNEYPETSIFIIPIRIENCNPTSERLRELHWIDMFDDWEDGLLRILKTIKSQSDT